MLWTGAAAAVSESFKDLLLELAQERSLAELLPLVTRRLAEHEDVALARLWLVEPGDLCRTCPNAAACSDRARCLHLAASAGRGRDGAAVVHRNLDGAFRRIPIGAFKVGQVAARRAPAVVSDPLNDPTIRRPEWVRAEGIAGFAGLPLTCRGELLGVLGVFLRAPITAAAMDVLQILANHTAAAIATARAFAEIESDAARACCWRTTTCARAPRSRGAGRHRGRQRAAAARCCARSPRSRPPTRPCSISGESGTGKELVARAIHCTGAAAARPARSSR